MKLTAIAYDFTATGGDTGVCLEVFSDNEADLGLPIVYVSRTTDEIEICTDTHTDQHRAAEWFQLIADYLHADQPGCES